MFSTIELKLRVTNDDQRVLTDSCVGSFALVCMKYIPYSIFIFLFAIKIGHEITFQRMKLLREHFLLLFFCFFVVAESRGYLRLLYVFFYIIPKRW
jgi:hypothetical protein